VLFLRRLTIGGVLGEGAFGVVLKADARGIGNDKGAVASVAVKTIKGMFLTAFYQSIRGVQNCRPDICRTLLRETSSIEFDWLDVECFCKNE
jgi:hypothetical protein